MVANAPDPALAFAEYTQQLLGVPWPTLEDQRILRRKANDLFAHCPRADYYTLCRVAQWCRARNRRCARVWMVVECFRAAWASGALPELDPTGTDEHTEARIRAALTVEQRASWRQRLLAASGTTARRAAIDAWEAQR